MREADKKKAKGKIGVRTREEIAQNTTGEGDGEVTRETYQVTTS
jgi:hypothetical protein